MPITTDCAPLIFPTTVPFEVYTPENWVTGVLASRVSRAIEEITLAIVASVTVTFVCPELESRSMYWNPPATCRVRLRSKDRTPVSGPSCIVTELLPGWTTNRTEDVGWLLRRNPATPCPTRTKSVLNVYISPPSLLPGALSSMSWGRAVLLLTCQERNSLPRSVGMPLVSATNTQCSDPTAIKVPGCDPRKC